MRYLQKMEEVRAKVPRIGLLSVNCENSPYVSYTGNSKNSHLLFGGEHDENCYYGFWLHDSKDSADCDYCQKCELCYDCVDCLECYNVSYSQDCANCSACEYCYDCVGCQNCFGCTGQRRKSYMIGNKEVDRSEYETKLKEFKEKNSQEQLRSMLEQVKRQAPHSYVHVLNNENSTGDYVYNSKDSDFCFDVKQLENCLYCNNSVQLKDCVDMSNGYFNSELNYEVMSEMNLYNCNFCVTCFDSQNLEHCESLYNCSNCFGCFGLKHKDFYIFNEPYSEEDYYKKVKNIRKEMMESGEYMKFLPSTYPFEDSNASMEFTK